MAESSQGMSDETLWPVMIDGNFHLLAESDPRVIHATRAFPPDLRPNGGGSTRFRPILWLNADGSTRFRPILPAPPKNLVTPLMPEPPHQPPASSDVAKNDRRVIEVTPETRPVLWLNADESTPSQPILPAPPNNLVTPLTAEPPRQPPASTEIIDLHTQKSREYARNYRRQRKQNETPEQRARRLEKGRESSRRYKARLWPWQREKRLEQHRQYSRKRRQQETPEQRGGRNEKKRQYARDYYYRTKYGETPAQRARRHQFERDQEKTKHNETMNENTTSPSTSGTQSVNIPQDHQCLEPQDNQNV